MVSHKNKFNIGNGSGFGIVAVLAVCGVLVVVGLSGWVVYRHDHKTVKMGTTSVSQSSPKKMPVADPYAGWKTYLDTGYSQSSGISIKYPSDWQVNVGNSKAFAWVIVNSATPQASIDVRTVNLSSSNSAQQEWDDCPTADACGATSGDTKLEGNTASINGLDSYQVKMRSTSGIYHATVIKSNKPSTDGTSAFDEFMLYSDDSTLLHTYDQIIATAAFPN